MCRFKWGALPAEQRDGIRNFVSNLIIKVSTDEAAFTKEKIFLNKLNVILVQVGGDCNSLLDGVPRPTPSPFHWQILKHDWPTKWPTFVPDLVAASQQSETLCENSMTILKLLSEEVFDFSKDEMTQAKVKQLKQSLNSEFARIHDLCMFVLQASRQVEVGTRTHALSVARWRSLPPPAVPPLQEAQPTPGDPDRPPQLPVLGASDVHL